MRLPPIDFSKLIQLLKSEGHAELFAAGTAKFASLTLVREWNNIILVLEKEIVPLLIKGCDANSLKVPAKKLAMSTGTLSAMAAEALSFVPGPVGIICSIALAIGCFSTGNIVGGFFELLGCIPGGKVAGKATSKLFPKIEKIMIEIVQSNDKLKIVVETASKQHKAVTEFFQKHASKPKAKPKAEVGYEYGVKESFHAPKTGNMPSLEEAMQINMGKKGGGSHIPPPDIPKYNNYYYPESTNSMIYRLGTNTGKSIL